MPRGERAEHEIFEARLGRARVAALEAGEDVGGEALQLEADIEGEQVGGRDHHPHADRREQDQHRIFGAIVAVAAEPAHRRQHRRRRRRRRSRSWRKRRSCRRRTGRRRRCRRRRGRRAGRAAATASASTASQVSSGAERSPAQAAASISSKARDAQISPRGGPGGSRCSISDAPPAGAGAGAGRRARRQLRVARRRGALDPREQIVDVGAHRRDEAFRIDAHPQHRRGDRREDRQLAQRRDRASPPPRRCGPRRRRSASRARACRRRRG